MTVIATVSPFAVPMIMADVLVSDDTTLGPEIALPTAGGSRRVHGAGTYVSLWLHQKLCIVRDYLAFAVAGPLMKAIELRNDLRSFTDKGAPTPSALRDFIDGLGKFGAVDPTFSFVLLLQNTVDRRITFQLGRNVVRTPWAAASSPHECLFAGSGTQGFAQALALNGSLVTNSRLTWFHALSSAGGVISQLLAQEFHAISNAGKPIANPLRDFYGGAYELAYATATGIVKVPGTQLFWRGGVRDGKPYIDPLELVLNRDYDGDDLVLRWGRPAERNFETRILHADQTCITVPPLSWREGFPRDRAAWPKLGTGLDFHSIAIDGPDGPTLVVVAHWDDTQGRHPDVEFTEEADATLVRVPLSTQRKLAQSVGHRLRLPKEKKK